MGLDLNLYYNGQVHDRSCAPPVMHWGSNILPKTFKYIASYDMKLLFLSANSTFNVLQVQYAQDQCWASYSEFVIVTYCSFKR